MDRRARRPTATKRGAGRDDREYPPPGRRSGFLLAAALARSPFRVYPVRRSGSARRRTVPTNFLTDSGLGDGRGIRLTVKPVDLVRTVIVVIVSTLIAEFVASRYDDVAAALIFVLGIMVAGAFGGLVCALIAALSAFLIFNFLITEPILTFRLATGRDLAPLFIFNLCAVVTGILSGRLRDRSEAARAANLQLNNVLRISRGLQSAPRLADVIVALEAVAAPLIGARLSLFRLRAGVPVPLGPSGEDAAVRRVAAASIAAGTVAFDDPGLVAIRLDGDAGPVGVLVLENAHAAALDPAFLQAVSISVALATTRAILSEQMEESRASVRAEELKTALLSSVSHDFRTPLAAISASASSLLEYGDRLDPVTYARFLRGIVDDCARLDRYTANLLEMSRLEAGESTTGLQTLGVADMLGVAVQHARLRARNRTLNIAVAGPDLLVRANPALFELVLGNVLDNAILYSPDASRIEISCRLDGDHCRIDIADQGCGIPRADLDRVFERFYRVSRAESSPRGSGLGLAIARGFVEALGGDIRASTPGLDGLGSRIVIRLPLAPVPVLA